MGQKNSFPYMLEISVAPQQDHQIPYTKSGDKNGVMDFGVEFFDLIKFIMENARSHISIFLLIFPSKFFMSLDQVTVNCSMLFKEEACTQTAACDISEYLKMRISTQIKHRETHKMSLRINMFFSVLFYATCLVRYEMIDMENVGK